MNKELAILKKFLHAEEHLSENEWENFADIWEPYSVKRKEIITYATQKEKYLYFVIEGVQRIYYASDDDKEATLIFTYPHSFGGVMDSFLLQKPSSYFYESLTPSFLLRTSFQKFNEVIQSNPKIDGVFKQLTFAALSGLLERMVELQCFSSEEKFKVLLKRSPGVLQLIPHKYLANYLGIDPSNFSKFLNTVRI